MREDRVHGHLDRERQDRRGRLRKGRLRKGRLRKGQLPKERLPKVRQLLSERRGQRLRHHQWRRLGTEQLLRSLEKRRRSSSKHFG